MKVSIIGTGYVGLVSGTCFAELGHTVTCIDIDEKKISFLREGKSPIYEPGLTDLLERNIEKKRLFFDTTYNSVADAKTIFLAVGTPSQENGQADLKYLESAAKSVAENISDGAIVVIKSTVPVGTSTKIEELIKSHTKKSFYLVNNPEFLKEGSAVEDFMRPDRVVIGYREEAAAKAMDELYAPLLRQGNPLYKMSNISAEMTKYAANCMLATKISFMNEVARLCDVTGADVEEVRKGIASDQRIGGHFLYPGPGYGGSCFPKDVKALIHTAKENDLDFKIVQATEEVNEAQKTYMFDKVKKHYGDLKGKNFAFWGVAFKANTDDVRESPAIKMAESLISEGASIQFYDPEAGANFLREMDNNSSLREMPTMYDCLENTDALITMTEWREFRSPDFKEIKNRLSSPVIFDARNLFETEKAIAEGFKYYAIGKHIS